VITCALKKVATWKEKAAAAMEQTIMIDGSFASNIPAHIFLKKIVYGPTRIGDILILHSLFITFTYSAFQHILLKDGSAMFMRNV
jgi:hypothetical protein